MTEALQDQIKVLAQSNESLTNEVKQLRDKLHRVMRPPDERMKEAADIIAGLKRHVQLLEGKAIASHERVPVLQTHLNDALDAVKDRAWFLVIEMDGEREVLVCETPTEARRLYDNSRAGTVFLCSVLKGPTQMLDKLTGAFKGKIA